jgi:hypothetical protein
MLISETIDLSCEGLTLLCLFNKAFFGPIEINYGEIFTILPKTPYGKSYLISVRRR